MWNVLSAMWWIYILIMSPALLFSGGFTEFFVGFIATIVLLLLPFVFKS